MNADRPAQPPPPGLEAPPPEVLPRHLAIIMDGNGRWAEQRGLPRPEGHAAGARTVNLIVRTCRELGIRHLTLYAFSAQNWGRPHLEVDALMHLLLDYVRGERMEILGNGIRLTTIGDIGALPEWVRGPLHMLCAESARNQGMTLTLALSYGGREELVRAVQQVAREVAAGRLAPADIDAEALAARLDTAGFPDPDLVVRTSGEERLSNFLLWQSAYAELYFSPVAWPDFEASHLHQALQAYAARQRRYGLTAAQLAAEPETVPC